MTGDWRSPKPKKGGKVQKVKTIGKLPNGKHVGKLYKQKKGRKTMVRIVKSKWSGELIK